MTTDQTNAAEPRAAEPREQQEPRDLGAEVRTETLRRLAVILSAGLGADAAAGSDPYNSRSTAPPKRAWRG